MRALPASRLPLAATLLAAIAVASPAAAESVNYLKYNLRGFGMSQSSSAMNDLPTLPGGPSSVQQPKAMQGHAAPAPSGPKLTLPSAAGVHPHGHVNQYDLHFTKILDRASPAAPGKPAKLKAR
jgi:hypothetical protein